MQCMVTVTQLVVVGEGWSQFLMLSGGGAIIYGPMILAILLYLPLECMGLTPLFPFAVAGHSH